MMSEPHWDNNACGHPPETFIGTIHTRWYESCWIQGDRDDILDIYVYTSYGRPNRGQAWNNTPHLCIRFGNHPSDYYSCGPLTDVLRHVDLPHLRDCKYQRAAVAYILENGVFTYRKL